MSIADQELGPDEVWTISADQVLCRLATTPSGITTEETRLRQTIYGLNDTADPKRSPLWLQFLARFRSPLVIILLVASALSATTGDIASFVIVAVIVTASMTLDFVQEARAQNAPCSRRERGSVSLFRPRYFSSTLLRPRRHI